jgi:glutamine---fructose-6-phosphate transaminase (isomerizing)
MTPADFDESRANDALINEIHEQPETIRRLLDNGLIEFRQLARTVAEKGTCTARLVGHGTSANAALAGARWLTLLTGMTAFCDSISLSVYDRAELSFTGSLAIAVSQSGGTPDVIEYLDRARHGGAITVAVTNEPASPLAQVAEFCLPICAGHERALAATKTYTAELATLAMFAATLFNSEEETELSLRLVADIEDAALPGLESMVAHLVQDLEPFSTCFVVGRGNEFPTARETALKITESCKVNSSALTSTEFQHGPVLAAGPGVPVFAVAARDPCLPSTAQAASRARGVGSRVIALGEAAAEVPADFRIATPQAPVTWLGPLISILPGQLIAWALARRLGIDIDGEQSLTKISQAL